MSKSRDFKTIKFIFLLLYGYFISCIAISILKETNNRMIKLLSLIMFLVVDFAPLLITKYK